MKQNKFLKFFSEQSKLSMRSVRTGEELWHIFISRGNFILAALALIVVLFVSTLTIVAYTSILDLVPGYPGNRSREMLISSITKLDSLEREVGLWESYTRDLQLILDGRRDLNSTDQADSSKTSIKGMIIERNDYDAKLRLQMAPNSSVKHDKRRNTELTFEMIAPVSGMIESTFSPVDGVFGVIVRPAPNSIALAVLDGTIILNSWSPEWGAVISIQHAGGMVSVYKGLARSLRATGDRIKAGQSVGVVEMVKDKHIPLLYFELWSSGNPIDPENYITF